MQIISELLFFAGTEADMNNVKDENGLSVEGKIVIVLGGVALSVLVIIGIWRFCKNRRDAHGRDNRAGEGQEGEILLHFTTHTIICV